MIASARSSVVEWIRLARMRDWMQSKLPFLTAMAVILAPSTTGAPEIIGVVATVVAGAAFGYGVNEVADRGTDARAGKVNHAARLGRRGWLPFLIATAVGATGLSLVWAPDAAAPVLVVLALALAAAYSLPPFRLKERGRLGLAAAATAQWAIPVLVVAAAESGGWLRPAAWLFALLGLAIGTRWIVAHQRRDAVWDRRSGVRTYALGRTNTNAVLYAAFGCELALLAAGLASAWPRSAAAAIAHVAPG
ncbi:MAG TPA: UbiA family prenyltransferase [Solirubrobacteraceae bacterium]|jgi:4-hydroxybenzoate polyprenyltransferase|nr:UbiA family prenyltransferase [Solirubrobacteraceae bacterium]